MFGATVIGGMSALQFACREGHVRPRGRSSPAAPNVNLVSGGEKTSPIVEAIINGHVDLAKMLLEQGADPTLANIDGLTPLYAVVDMRWRHNTWYPQPSIEQERTGYLDFMRELLDHGADVNAPIVRKLWFRKFRYGDDWVEPMDATPFWRAAQSNDIDAMRLLVAHGANPNRPDRHGVTPLMVAAGFGFEYQGTNVKPDSRLASVKYLVEELHADVNASERQEYTALHGAAYVGDNDLVEYLVSKGADARRAPTPGCSGRSVRKRPRTSRPAPANRSPTWRTVRARNRCCTRRPSRSSNRSGSENSHYCRSTACVNSTKLRSRETADERRTRCARA